MIWGTVLTTLFSNLLVPGIYSSACWRCAPRTFLRRTLGPPLVGSVFLVVAAWIASGLVVANPVAGGSRLARVVPLLMHLAVSLSAYVVGYLIVPAGRADLGALVGKLRRRMGR